MNGDGRVNNRDVLALQRDVESTPSQSCSLPSSPLSVGSTGGAGCGLGIELVPVLSALLALRGRLRARSSRESADAALPFGR